MSDCKGHSPIGWKSVVAREVNEDLVLAGDDARGIVVNNNCVLVDYFAVVGLQGNRDSHAVMGKVCYESLYLV